MASTHTRLTDFDNPASNAGWRMVNDDVMGGRSLGDVSFADGVMAFYGSINTNGGGFSSVRFDLEPGALAGASTIQLRVRADTRGPYRLMVSDDLPTRQRRISHQHNLELDPATPPRDWQTVAIDLSDLTPSWRGNRVRAAPLDPTRAVELGLILGDGRDGPFRLEIDWIDIVRP
ncbi:MAG: CIA30 family protein [Planctomycetota bacterium]